MRGFDRLSHAYIADGQMAHDLAMATICSANNSKPCRECTHCEKASRHIHPDIITIDRLKGKREIVVDQIRELKRSVYIAPNEAERKAYVINDAGTMNVSAQNAFLQMLEEPPPHAVFILKSSNLDAFLKTVRSRCVSLKESMQPPYGKPTQTEPERDAEEDTSQTSEAATLAADFVSALCDNLLLTKCMFRLEKLDRLAFSDFIKETRIKLVKILRNDLRSEKALTAESLLDNAAEMLELDVSTGHIAGFLCASLIRG